MSEIDDDRRDAQRFILQEVTELVDDLAAVLTDHAGGMPVAFFALTILLEQCAGELKREHGDRYWADTEPKFRGVAKMMGELFSEQTDEHTPKQREALVERVLDRWWALYPKN